MTVEIIYFMINLHESMGPGRDWTHDLLICTSEPDLFTSVYSKAGTMNIDDKLLFLFKNWKDNNHTG